MLQHTEQTDPSKRGKSRSIHTSLPRMRSETITNFVMIRFSQFMYDTVKLWIPTWVNMGFKNFDIAQGSTRKSPVNLSYILHMLPYPSSCDPFLSLYLTTCYRRRITRSNHTQSSQPNSIRFQSGIHRSFTTPFKSRHSHWSTSNSNHIQWNQRFER